MKTVGANGVRGTPRWAVVVGCILALGAGTYLAARLTYRTITPFYRRQFSAAAWHGDAPGARAAMVGSLLGNHLRPGLTRDEVIGLLGYPESFGSGAAWDRVYLYNMGNEADWPWRMDDVWLAIRFDARGRVSRCWFVQT